MKKPKIFIPIGIKIFGITTSLLCLLGIIALTAQYRLRRVNQEVSDLAQYITPSANHISRIEVQGLEQALHFEHILKLYALQPMDIAGIEKEWQHFENRSQVVDGEILAAMTLAQAGATKATIPAHQERFERIVLMLGQVERSHQDFRDAAVQHFQNLEKTELQNINTTSALNAKNALYERPPGIEKSIGELDRTISQSRLELDTFTQQTAQLSQHYQRGVLRDSLLITTGAIVFGLLYAAAVTAGIVRPVRQLTKGVQSIQAQSSEASEAAASQLVAVPKDEVGILANVFNHMLGELKAKENLRDIFGKYVDPRIIERLTDHDVTLNPKGEKKVVSVLMSDLDGVDLTERIPDPVHLVDAVNQYLDVLSPTIYDHQGLIEFVETNIKGFWTAPFVSEEQHAQLACEAALKQVSQFEKIRHTLAKYIDASFDIKQLDFHIGLATGPLVLANMGPTWSKTYTVLGDIVNTSARLKGAAKYFGVPILMMESTQQQVQATMATRELGIIQVVGKNDPLRVYELLDRQDQISEPLRNLKTMFEQGLAAYRRRAWPEAQTCFETCLTIEPDDGPTHHYLASVKTLQAQPLPQGWTGVWKLAKK